MGDDDGLKAVGAMEREMYLYVGEDMLEGLHYETYNYVAG